MGFYGLYSRMGWVALCDYDKVKNSHRWHNRRYPYRKLCSLEQCPFYVYTNNIYGPLIAIQSVCRHSVPCVQAYLASFLLVSSIVDPTEIVLSWEMDFSVSSVHCCLLQIIRFIARFCVVSNLLEGSAKFETK